jgi:hypothetical protein
MVHRNPVTLGPVRLYRDRELDRALIDWLDQFQDTHYGVKTQAIKEALLRGIGQVTQEEKTTAPVHVDAATIQAAIEEAMEETMLRIRRVVEAGVNSALRDKELTTQPQPVEHTADEQQEIDDLLDTIQHNTLIYLPEDEDNE